jgi:hypothetical protein
MEMPPFEWIDEKSFAFHERGAIARDACVAVMCLPDSQRNNSTHEYLCIAKLPSFQLALFRLIR